MPENIENNNLVFGIDLGTTFSAIAYIDEFKKPVIIPNIENKLTTPSVINFYSADSYVVGDEAVNRLLADPSNTVSFIKREMGSKDYSLSYYGKNYTPQEISAKILAKLKKDAESYFQNKGLNIEVKDVVITVPAYFGMEQRSATKDAGEIAGLNILNILNEPTAAALSYGINNVNKNNTVFVFDLGGGTFDVTILEIKGNDIKMLASDGDARLGGKDWDDKILSYCVENFKKENNNIDPQDNLDSYQELYDRVLRAKISLSTRPNADIITSADGKSYKNQMNVEKFEELSEDLLDRCKHCSELVLNKAGKKWDDIDTVLLVGGSTYMPMIRKLVENMSGKKPSTEVNPDLCVAQGAAWYGFLQKTEDIVNKQRTILGDKQAEITQKTLLGSLPSIKVTECVAKSLGIITIGADDKEFVFNLIKAQTPIPCEIVNDELTYHDNGQTSLRARLTEGEGSNVELVSKIGEFTLSGLPPRTVGDKIRIVLKYNKNKILELLVEDLETHKQIAGKVELAGGMDKEQKDDAIKQHISQTQK